jgi:hypothetical protein
VHHTDKAIVAIGRHNGEPVVIKLLTTADPYWRLRRTHEIGVYRRFQTDPPPVLAPRLIHADGDGLMLLTMIPGARLHDARHADADLSSAAVAAVLDTLNAVPTWTPATLPAAPIADYQGRVDAEHAAGLIDLQNRETISNLIVDCGDHREIQHGDPLPANLLIHGQNCGLVDWEHAGLYLPGWDLAVLDTVAGAASPRLRAAIDATVDARGIQGAYLVNLALVVAREVRIHRSLPSTDVLRAGRSAALDAAQRRVDQLLREVRAARRAPPLGEPAPWEGGAHARVDPAHR